MSAPDPTSRPARRPRVMRTVEVRRVDRVTPRVVRVLFAGPELAGFESRAPAEHIKVFLPGPGQTEPPRTVPGPDGPTFPADRPRPLSRTYTPRRFDPDRLQLEVDFVLHGDGPGSTWAARAQPGDVAVIAGPGGGYRRPPRAEWLLIGGDETSLPAISTVLRSLPSTARADVYVEVHDAAEEQSLDGPSRLTVNWLFQRGGGASSVIPGHRLEEAIRSARLPGEAGQVWIACEATAMRGIRAHLLHERGVDPSALYTRGYWQIGEPNHPDHDYGEEIT